MNCFCAEISSEVTQLNDLNFFPLKSAIDLLEYSYFPLVAKGAQIIDWDKNHRYCGLCGQQTKKIIPILEATCESCNLRYYPRISPSIIVLIKNKNQILMARGKGFPDGVYALIAGFVSPGETLEEAVKRETLEEVGIEIKNIRYFGSQPWPFPDSLMLAFTAEYDSGEIIVDDIEIEDAGWYNVNNLPGMPSSSKSIAKIMIDEFIKGHENSDNGYPTKCIF